MPRDDECEHGSTGYCGLCIAVGENKLSEKEAMDIHTRSGKYADKDGPTFPGEIPEDDHRC